MANKFAKGLVLSGLLAAGAAVGFALSKNGGKLTKELQKDLQVLAKNLKRNVDNVKDLSKEQFEEVVARVVEEHADQMKLAKAAKKKLVGALQDMWEDFDGEEEVKTAVTRAKKKLKT